MNTNNNDFFNSAPAQDIQFRPEQATAVRTFLAQVFGHMATALIISGGIAWWFGDHPELLRFMFNASGKMGILRWVVMLSPIGLVLAMGGLVNRLSSTMLLALFIAYSALTGLSLSFIFLAYTSMSVYMVFLMAAAVFAVMAVAGYTTKTDLTKLGSLLMFGVIALVIGSLINMFFASAAFNMVLNIISVVVFTGLTAYKMQQLKYMAYEVVNGSELARKMSIMAALGLYITFINLFLTLLRLFGSRRD